MKTPNLLKCICTVIIALAILTATLASALAIPSQIEIDPSSIDVVLNINQTIYYPVTVRNPSNETIYNLKFSNSSALMTTPLQLAFLGSNDSATLMFKFFANAEIDSSFVTTASFDYMLEVNQQPIIYQVAINESGFSMDNLTVYESDSVSFINNGTQSHSLTEINLTQDSLDKNLSVGEDYTLTPDRTYDFFDRVSGDTFYLRVTPRDPSSLVHSSALDRPFSIRLRATPAPVTLNVDLLTPSHEVHYNETVQGVIRVYNPTNVTAYNVNMSAPWVTFLENGIDILGKTMRVITYNMSPQNITSINQTNRTYLLPVSVTGVNVAGINATNLSISAFIPWQNLSVIQRDGVIIYQNVLDVESTLAVCGADPEYPGCDKLIRYEYKDRVITVKENISITPESVEEAIAANVDTKEIVEHYGNKVTSMETSLNENVEPDIQDIKRELKSIKTLIDGWETDKQDQARKKRNRKIWYWFLGVLFVIGLIIAYAVRRGSQTRAAQEASFLGTEAGREVPFR